MERLNLNEVIEPKIEGKFPQTVSISSDDSLIDRLFMISCALRCKTLPCTLKKIEKNRDLLTRPVIANLKGNGYEEDDEGNLFKLLKTDDGIQKVAGIMRLPLGSVAPWGAAFFPTGSGFNEAMNDLEVAVESSLQKVLNLGKIIFIQVDFLKDDLIIPSMLLHTSVIHYQDAIDFVNLNRSIALEITNNFGILHPVMLG